MILRDYQLSLAYRCADLLKKYGLAYLCLEVRVGKTLTAFKAASLHGAKRVLFVTKLKAVSSIRQDYEAVKPWFDLFLVNYESLHKVTDDFDLIICDECHCLGQYPKPSERTKELKRICRGKPIIYLSGTPTPESYSQLFHQFWISDRSPWNVYDNFYKWFNTFGIPGVKYLYNRQIADYSKTIPDLRETYNHLLITYTQSEAGFESPLEEEIIYLPMPEKVKWAIDKLKRSKIITVKSGQVILGDTAVKEMNKVHQLCGGTVKFEDGEAMIIDYSKADYIKGNYQGKKIAVFYKYVAEEMALRTRFGKRIVTDPMEFKKGNDECAFISQVQSGREGVDLSTADVLIMYNVDFAAVSYWQARARLQTKDRVKPALVHWLFFTCGIEAEIYKAVCGKKDFTLSHYRKWSAPRKYSPAVSPIS